MYARYKKTRVGSGTTQYELQQEEIHLFGCIQGYIPWLLKPKIPAGQGGTYKWHIDVVAELGSHQEYPDNTLLIDLKPKQNKTNVSLYELMDVWGYSEDGWSPILLRLNGLFVDKDPSSVDRNTFMLKDDDISGPIYEFMYLNGSVEDGDLYGQWTSPPTSPTNAVLLWPEPLNYFLQCIRSRTPEVLQI